MTEKSCGWAWRHLNQNDGAGTNFAGREHSAEPIRRGRAERRGNTPRRRAVCPQRSDEGHAEGSLWLYRRGQSSRRIAPTRTLRRIGAALPRQERPTPKLTSPLAFPLLQRHSECGPILLRAGEDSASARYNLAPDPQDSSADMQITKLTGPSGSAVRPIATASGAGSCPKCHQPIGRGTNCR